MTYTNSLRSVPTDIAHADPVHTDQSSLDKSVFSHASFNDAPWGSAQPLAQRQEQPVSRGLPRVYPPFKTNATPPQHRLRTSRLVAIPPSLSSLGQDDASAMSKAAISPSEGGGGSIEIPSDSGFSVASPQEYRLYKRRWVGLLAIFVLNIVGGMSLVWFGPIANSVVDDFGFTLNQINWFGNVVNVMFLPSSLAVPYMYGWLGIRKTCYIGSLLFVISAWIRFAGTARSIPVNGAYALIVVGQLLAGCAVPIVQVVVPSYSERWFDLRGRTTATMIMSLGNPVGNGLGQLISPAFETSRQSLLVMAIIYTAVAPAVFLVAEAPPTPPTFAASHKHASLASLGRAMLGKVPRDRYIYMTPRQRIDFAIIVIVFGIIVGIVNAFTILTAQQLEPYGYSDDTSGFMGATLLLVGLAAAAITSPLFDRVFTNHLVLATKALVPAMAACWLALIWEIKPNNDAVLYVLMAIIGGTSLTLLPVVLELAVELTRNADGSSAILWFSTNLFALVFVLVEGALRAGPDANPPLNMHRAIIFQAVMVTCAVSFVYLVEGKQTRRTQDEQKREEADRVTHQLQGERETGVAVVAVQSQATSESQEEMPESGSPNDLEKASTESGKEISRRSGIIETYQHT